MSDREDRLRSLLDKVRAKRPDERATTAADALERIRTASGTTAAAAVQSSPPLPTQSSRPPASTAPPTPVPSAFPTELPSSPLPEPPTSPSLDSPTRYSSQPPQVERPLSIEPRARSIRPSSPSGAHSGAPVPGPSHRGVLSRFAHRALRPPGSQSFTRPIRPSSHEPRRSGISST